MSALFTVFLRFFPAVIIVLLILVIVIIGYMLMSHFFRGSVDSIQKTTQDNIEYLEGKFPDKDDEDVDDDDMYEVRT